MAYELFLLSVVRLAVTAAVVLPVLSYVPDAIAAFDAIRAALAAAHF